MWLMEGQHANVRPDGSLSSKERGSFTAPAREPAYDFEVAVYCSWKPPRRRWPVRWEMDSGEMAYVYEIIRGTVRRSCTEFSIFAPATAEQAINARLADRLDNAAQSAQSISPGWTARAELRLPAEVLALMRKALDEEYEIRTKATAATLLMSTTGELREGWDRFLDNAAGSPNAQHAVRLAENPRNVAQVLEEVLQDRRKGAEKLLTLIDKIVAAHQSVDILDLVINSETVLRETLKMMGIPLPATDGGSLLAPLEGEI
jgi:hypothetical protein